MGPGTRQKRKSQNARFRMYSVVESLIRWLANQWDVEIFRRQTDNLVVIIFGKS